MAERNGPLRNGGGGWSEERTILFFCKRHCQIRFLFGDVQYKKSLAQYKAFKANHVIRMLFFLIATFF